MCDAYIISWAELFPLFYDFTDGVLRQLELPFILNKHANHNVFFVFSNRKVCFYVHIHLHGNLLFNFITLLFQLHWYYWTNHCRFSTHLNVNFMTERLGIRNENFTKE